MKQLEQSQEVNSNHARDVTGHRTPLTQAFKNACAIYLSINMDCNQQYKIVKTMCCDWVRQVPLQHIHISLSLVSKALKVFRLSTSLRARQPSTLSHFGLPSTVLSWHFSYQSLGCGLAPGILLLLPYEPSWCFLRTGLYLRPQCRQTLLPREPL
jgi:hypothetical protein